MDGTCWDYDAPTFIDFQKEEHERDVADDYFDYDHENLKSLTSTEGDSLDQTNASNIMNNNNNSRLTFDTPKKINLQIPKIKHMETEIKGQERNEMPSAEKFSNQTISTASVLESNAGSSPCPSIDTNQNILCKTTRNLSEQPADSLDEMTESEVEHHTDEPITEMGVEFESQSDSDIPTSSHGKTTDSLPTQPVDSLEEMTESDTEQHVNVPIQPADSLEKMTESEVEHHTDEPITDMRVEFESQSDNDIPISSHGKITDSLSIHPVTESETEEHVNVPIQEPQVNFKPGPRNEQAVNKANLNGVAENEPEMMPSPVPDRDTEVMSSPVPDQDTEMMPSPVPDRDIREKEPVKTPQDSPNMQLDEPCPTEPQVERNDPLTPKVEPKNNIPSNMITPSRFAMWEQSRRRRSVMPALKKTDQRRSERVQKLKEFRHKEAKKPDPEPPTKKMKRNVNLVMPTTPTVLKHQRHATGPRMKSREERELEEIEELKNQQKERLKESNKSFKAALKGPALRPPTPTKKTKVEEFRFATDERIKTHPMETRTAKLPSEVDFTKQLRQHPPSPKKLNTTKVKPFNFSNNRKRKLELQPKCGFEFTPMAKAVIEFQRETRSQTATGNKKGPMKAKPGLTVAKTPKLQSKSRKRAPSVVSAQEKEEMEIEEMKSYQFRAKPANRKILEQPTALPEVAKHPSTKPEGFHLLIDERVEERPKHERTPSPKREFHARPIPKTVLEGDLHIVKSDRALLTVAQSPAFKLKNRMEVSQKIRENKENERKERERMQSQLDESVRSNVISKKQPEVPQKRNVKVKPFSFHDKDKERFAKKEEKIKEIHEKEKAAASAFKARPILEEDPYKALPQKQAKENTTIEPFNLLSDERGAVKSKRWKSEVERDLKTLKEKMEFKANTQYKGALTSKPWKPFLSKKSTEFSEFNLHTNTRAIERQDFDEALKEREAMQIAAQERRKEEEEKIAQQEMAEMRKQAEFEAAPIRKYKEVVIKESEKWPTQPQSPNFSDRFYKKIPAQGEN